MIKRTGHRRGIEAILPFVEKPHRYLGNELNVTRKRADEFDVRVALVFPEVYEIGMSWPGQQILYNLLNARRGVLAERAYAVWPDMEARMREQGVPAFSLESWTPLREFDILGITLQYELVFTNILTLLDLAGIPLRSRERGREDPLVLAGGPVAFNPEPMAEFLDAVALGDGEDVFLDICEVQKGWKGSGEDRGELLRRLSRVPGVYVPSLHDVEYNETVVDGWGMGSIRGIAARDGAPASVRRRWVEDLNRVPFPARPIVALGKTVHSRLGIEVQRGCTRACRFCQAGYIYRPERQREPERVKQIVAESLASTGHDEVSLLSLSIGDYGCLDTLLGDLLGPNPRSTNHLAVSLPSIRADTLREAVVEKIASARKTGFTIAPEAGSPRLRDVINKALSEEEIARAAEIVFQRGWTHIKFYYMIGLPTETDDDVMGIVRTARMCQAIGRKHTRKADIVVSTSTFIPKAFTPFQWEPQIARQEILRKQDLLRAELRKSNLTYRYHESRESFLEAVLSRGDRRLGSAIERAWRMGARFDGWQEHFKEDLWRQAFADYGIEPGFYAHRRIPVEEALPWDHIDCGVTKEWLVKDYRNGLRGKFVPDCATGRCYDCGVCDWEVIKNRTYVSRETKYYPQGVAPRGKGAHPREIETAGKAAPLDAAPPVAEAATGEARRFRVRFAKRDRASWLGHLDLMEIIARAFKRAGVRVAYSQGFHPKPRFSFGPALMTGAESECEFFDVDVLSAPAGEGVAAWGKEESLESADKRRDGASTSVEAAGRTDEGVRKLEGERGGGASMVEWIARVNGGLPEGIALLEAVEIERSLSSLGASIRGAVYEISDRLPGTLPDAAGREEALERFLGADSVEITTTKKTYDVRPFVGEAGVTDEGFRLEIGISPKEGSAKPADVARAILGWPESEASRAAGLRIVKVATLFGLEPAAAWGEATEQ